MLSAGARADQRDKNGVAPLNMLPTAVRPEVERLMQRARVERALARTPGGGGASNMDHEEAAVDLAAAAAVDPGSASVMDPGSAAVVDPGSAAAVDP